MRFTRRPRAAYTVTDRKRAGAARAQRRHREAFPLLAPLIAESQPGIDAVMTYWNGHRWLPGDPSYLLDLLHGFTTGRLLMEHGQIRPAVITIPVAMATAAFGPAKPVARAWFGSAPHRPGPARTTAVPASAPSAPPSIEN